MGFSAQPSSEFGPKKRKYPVSMSSLSEHDVLMTEENGQTAGCYSCESQETETAIHTSTKLSNRRWEECVISAATFRQKGQNLLYITWIHPAFVIRWLWQTSQSDRTALGYDGRGASQYGCCICWTYDWVEKFKKKTKKSEFPLGIDRKLGSGLPLSHRGWPFRRNCTPSCLSLQAQHQRLLAWRPPLAWWVCTGGFLAGGSDCHEFHY